jgi:hypothetical protein
MDAINRARRRFYLRPGYLARHAGDLFRLALTRRSASWEFASRVLFGPRIANTAAPLASPNQRAA